MAPSESHQLRRGKYARLDAPADDDLDIPTRFSSDSTGTLEDLEEYDPLAFDRKLKRKKSAGDLKVRKASFKDAEAAAVTPHARRNKVTPGRCCCWLLTFVAATVLLLAAGGIWAYKASVPLDGLSPPWYPTPKGGADPAWEESYKKAAELVKQMTLVEKVNITTGTGWSMDMCVGNNGAVPRLKFPQLCLQVYNGHAQTPIRVTNVHVGRPARYSLCRQHHRFPCRHHRGSYLEQGPHVPARQGTCP